jgi:GH35 family endo-1,4-beta-xylanase
MVKKFLTTGMVVTAWVAMVQAASLTPEEVQQYADDLGVVLTAAEQQQIANLVKPDVVLPWRSDAEARIEQHRKADLAVQVVDVNGIPIEGAQVDVKLKDHDFRFSGVLRVKDLTDAENKLDGISTNRYQEIFQKLYNGVGLNNGLKQRLRGGFESYLPAFFNWAQGIGMPVRGHLLMWPGGTHMTPAVTEKVEALEMLWDNVYLSKQYGTAAVTNDTVATVDALAGDAIVVLWSSNKGGEPVEANLMFSGTASLSSPQFDRATVGASVAYWMSDVTAAGTVDIDISKMDAYSSVVVYHLRPDGGAISLLDTVTAGFSNVSGLTNTYSFAGPSSGILLEGVSAYVGGIYPQMAEWVLVNDRRKSAHSYFNNVTTLESIWIHDSSGNTAVCGLAFANARVVGEQEAKLAEPALQQELKDQIEADISEWASLWPVYEWDVINETRANHRIQDLIGWDQMAEWFKIGASNSVLPECQYLLNEYGVISASPVAIKPTEYTANRDTMMSHLDIIQTKGAPLNRIGFQSRITRGYLDPDVVYDRLDDFGTRYDLEMVATEFEVREKDTFPVDETLRAQITEEMLTTYFSHRLVSGFTAWTYMTVEDWAMCSYDGTVKLNGLVWYYLHRIRYITDESAAADVAGEVAVRGFKGDYDITVSYNGKDYPVEYTLLSNQTVVVMLNDVDMASELYGEWLADFPELGGETNLLDNTDGDRWENLAEYALGGNPIVPDSASDFQTLKVNGTNYMEFVYSRRSDAFARGLDYQLFHTTNLVDEVWMTNRFESVGTGAIDTDFESVTNRIPTDVEHQQFIKLQVERL